MRLPQTLGLLLALLCGGLLAPTRAEEKKADTPPPQQAVRIECQMIILPQAEFQQVLPQLQDRKRVEEGWAQVTEWMKSGTAQLASLLTLPSVSGQRSQIESVEEFRYPTEFEPPQVPGTFEGGSLVDVLKNWPAVGSPPTSFETRNIGTTLEVEVVAEGENCSVNVAANHTRFLRFAKYEAFRMANGEKFYIDQPIFHVMKNQTALRMRLGERVLLSTHRVPEVEKPSYELILLRLTAE